MIEVFLRFDDDEQWGRVSAAVEAAHPGVTCIPSTWPTEICTGDDVLREAIQATIDAEAEQ